MTTINLLFILGIATMAAAGFLGLGKGWVKSGGSMHVPMVTPTSDKAVELHPESRIRKASLAGSSAEPKYLSFDDVKGDFDKIPQQGDQRITFDEFKSGAKSLDSLVPPTQEIAALKEKLKKPETLFGVNSLGPDALRNFIKPRPGEPFNVGDGVELAWVSDDPGQAGSGFWFSTTERAKKPPEVFDLPEGIKLSVKWPSVEQWQAARKNNTNDAIKDLDGGKGEYLVDEMVIGQSEMAKGEKWNQPWDPAKRIGETKAIPEPAEPSDEDIKKMAKELSKEKLNYRDKIPEARAALNEKAKTEARDHAVTETFAYRFVIESPIP
ncbi:MAG: hypothetical protein NTW21_19480 [Verrucomicrobia bacterium]|nr:hypothetical protein [Verrucomicrobiota bacterium]